MSTDAGNTPEAIEAARYRLAVMRRIAAVIRPSGRTTPAIMDATFDALLATAATLLMTCHGMPFDRESVEGLVAAARRGMAAYALRKAKGGES